MHAFAAAALVLAALAPTTDVDPPTEPVTAEVVNHLGRACPEGGFTISVAQDNRSFTLSSVGPGIVYAAAGARTTVRDWRKPCLIGLRVNAPEGYTYAVGSSSYRGFALLERGANATMRTSFYFQGQSTTHNRSFRFEGPRSDDWAREDRVGIDELVFHPCGAKRNLNMNIELQVARGTSDPDTTSYLFRDAGETTWDLHWSRCP